MSLNPSNLCSLGQLATESGESYGRLRYVAWQRRNRIEPALVVNGLNFFDEAGRRAILEEIDRLNAARLHNPRNTAVPA